MIISKMLFLELWEITQSSFQSIQLKELGNTILHTGCPKKKVIDLIRASAKNLTPINRK